MSEDASRPFAPIDVEMEAALRAISRPAARAGFREELRSKFLPVEGAPEEAKAWIATARSASERFSSDEFGAGAHATGAANRRRTFLRVGALVAASLILAVGFFVFQSQAPRWKVIDLAAGSLVKADGAVLPVDDRPALARALQAAREIEVEKGDLVVQIGDLSLFDLGEGTRVSFSGFDPGATDKPFQVRTAAGRVRARTGPGFRGRKMRVSADVFDVVVTGTAFAVDYEEAGTCICCLHGEIEVTSKSLGPEAKAVAPERMCFMYRDKREPRWGEPPDKHKKPLMLLEERAREIWR